MVYLRKPIFDVKYSVVRNAKFKDVKLKKIIKFHTFCYLTFFDFKLHNKIGSIRNHNHFYNGSVTIGQN